MIKITQPMLCQCIRLLTARSQQQSPDRPFFLRLLRKFEQRYGFLQAPRTVADYNINNGIIFLEGQHTNTLISKFTLSSNGVLAEANASTDDIDRFLDDVISWTNTEFGRVEFEERTVRRAYLSQLEVQIDLALGRAFSEFVGIGTDITDRIQKYGQNTNDFELSSVAFHCDVSNLEIPRPGVPFTIARREGKLYGENIYFASAPLRTPDQLEVLEQLLRLLAARTASSPSMI